MSRPYTASTIVFDTQAANTIRALGFKIPEPTQHSHFENGMHLLKTGTDDFSSEATLQEFGPIVSRDFNALGAVLTGESFRVKINVRAGGALERIYITEPGGITDENVLVTTRSYGRGMESSMFFQTAEDEMFVTNVARGATTTITTSRNHGIDIGRYCAVSIRESGFELGTVTPTLNGTYYAKGITATTLELYSDYTTPTAYDTSAGAGSYKTDNCMRLAILNRHNPTEAGGYFPNGGGAYSAIPVQFGHSSILVSATYTPVVVDGSGNVTSATLETVSIPAEWDPRGTMNTDYGTFGATYATRGFNHGGSEYGPVFWTGIVLKKTITFNPVVDGIADYGVPGVWRYENEIKFLKPIQNFASASGATTWLGNMLASVETPNAHFKAFVIGQRCFANRIMWRGGNNTTVNLTGRNFKAAGDPSLGTWDEDDHTVFINSENGGVAKIGPLNNGNPDAAEIIAVVGDGVTQGIWALIHERDVAGTEFAFTTVMHHSTVSLFGRHNLMSYQVSTGDGTVDEDGQWVEQLSVGADMRDYTGTLNNARVQGPELDTIPAGYTMKNWSHIFWAKDAAQLTTDWGGLGFGKLYLALVNCFGTVL